MEPVINPVDPPPPLTPLGDFTVVDDGYTRLRIEHRYPLKATEPDTTLKAYHGEDPVVVAILEYYTWYLIEIRVHPQTYVYHVSLNEEHKGSFHIVSPEGQGYMTLGDTSYDSLDYGFAAWDNIVVASLHNQPWTDDFEDNSVDDWTVVSSSGNDFSPANFGPEPPCLHVKEVVGEVSYGFSPKFNLLGETNYDVSFKFHSPTTSNQGFIVLSDGWVHVFLDGLTLKALVSSTDVRDVGTLTVSTWHDIRIHVDVAKHRYDVDIDGTMSPAGPFPITTVLDYTKYPLDILLGDIEDGFSQYGEGYWDDLDIRYPIGAATGEKINEVMYDPLTGEDWVEFYNTRNYPLSLNGFEITDEDGSKFTFPDHVPMSPPGSYTVVHFEIGASDTEFGQTQPNALHLYAPPWERFELESAAKLLGDLDAANIDGYSGDTDIDVVTGISASCGCWGWDISWWEHPGDPSQPWTKHTIDWAPDNDPSQATDAARLSLLDADFDGDPDLFVGGWGSGRIILYGNFLEDVSDPRWEKKIIDSLFAVRAMGVDYIWGSDYPDVAAIEYPSNILYWYENDGTPYVGNWQRYTVGFDAAYNLALGDIDGNGRIDIFTQKLGSPSTIGYFENTGATQYWDYEAVDTLPSGSWLGRPMVEDLNDDGLNDIVVTLPVEGEIAWYENNLDKHIPSGPDFVRRLIVQRSPWTWLYPGMRASNVDNDGDLDLAVSSQQPYGHSFGDVYWYENRLDEPIDTWIPHEVIDRLFDAHGLDVVLVDSDNLPDIVVAHDGKISWFTRRMPEFGDVDQVSLYVSDLHNAETITDFVAWGDDAGDDDDIASDAGIWTEHTYVDTSMLGEGQTIGRDRWSTDTDKIDDWSVQSPSQGSQNPYPP